VAAGDFCANLSYEPAESSSPIYGGNSNWRGPVWFPVNFLMIESLQMLDRYFGDEMRVEMPTGSGKMMSLWQVAEALSVRLIDTFRRNPAGKRYVASRVRNSSVVAVVSVARCVACSPVHGTQDAFSSHPRWANLVPFYEYFHGDNGAGIGASHQTGWTALVAKLIQQSGHLH
jgi:hypothetical protein